MIEWFPGIKKLLRAIFNYCVENTKSLQDIKTDLGQIKIELRDIKTNQNLIKRILDSRTDAIHTNVCSCIKNIESLLKHHDLGYHPFFEEKNDF